LKHYPKLRSEDESMKKNHITATQVIKSVFSQAQVNPIQFDAFPVTRNTWKYSI